MTIANDHMRRYEFSVESRFSGLVLMVRVYNTLLKRVDEYRPARSSDLPEFFRQLGASHR